MMNATMVSVIDDVTKARKIATGGIPAAGGTELAYQARRRIHKAGFTELRSACLRYGDKQVTPLFLQVDKEIDDFASKVWCSQTGVPKMVGDLANILGELDRIEEQANTLREKSAS